MRVVVTGALGYIGSRLIGELAAAFPRVEIVMIDNLAAGRHVSLSALPESDRFEFFKADILDADLERLFAGADAVIHLAALTNGASSDQRALMRRVNVDGTDRVARGCISTGAALLFPSTTSVYCATEGVVAEDCAETQIAPQSDYALSKLESERRLQRLVDESGLRCVTFRMGTIFGPSAGMSYHTAVNRFCRRAVSGQPLEIWRTASHQVRPYLDLSDAVRAMTHWVCRRRFDADLYNVVSLNATVTEVVEVIATLVADVSTVFVDSPLMNRLSYSVDASRFAAQGFAFRGSLAAGIGATIAMLRRREDER